jgi:hypothetical protein
VTDDLPDAAGLEACLAARRLAVPPDQLPTVLAGAWKLARAARLLREAEAQADPTP